MKYLYIALFIAGGLSVGYISGQISDRNKTIAEQTAQIKTLEADLALEKENVANAQAAVIVDTQYIDRVRTIKQKADVIIREVPSATSCDGLADIVRYHRASISELRQTEAANH